MKGDFIMAKEKKNIEEMNEEELKEYRAKQARKAERKEVFMDGVAAIGGCMAAIVVPFLVIWGIGAATNKSAEKKQNLKDDGLAQAYGYSDHNDPGFIKFKHEEQLEQNALYFKAIGASKEE
jgi:hypothetical protein